MRRDPRPIVQGDTGTHLDGGDEVRDESQDHSDAAIPDVNARRTSVTQTSEGDWDCNAHGTSPSTAISMCSAPSECCCRSGHQNTPLVVEHDETLDVLFGLTPDDAVIQPCQGGRSRILLSNFTGYTRCMERDVVGRVVEAEVVQEPAGDISTDAMDST